MPVRKFVYYSLYIPLLLVISTIAFTFGLLVPVPPRQSFATLWNIFVTTTLLRWVYGIEVELHGRENIPRDTNFVAIANHQCEWETLYLPRILRPCNVVLKKELLRIPFFGWGLLVMDHVAIDRSKARESITRIEEEGLKRLQKGRNMLIFPEATRVPLGKYRRFTRTGAKLAIDSGLPVLPIAHTAGNCWTPAGDIRPGKIDVWIGEPVSSKGKELDELSDSIEAWIRAKAALPTS